VSEPVDDETGEPDTVSCRTTVADGRAARTAYVVVPAPARIAAASVRTKGNLTLLLGISGLLGVVVELHETAAR
jgi:hypothetical protein